MKSYSFGRNVEKRVYFKCCVNILISMTHTEYAPPISKESIYFDYGIGMLYEGSEVLEGYRIWEVPPTLWAVFKCIGTDGDCIGEMWERIFNEFRSGSVYNMLDDTDCKLYYENGKWVAFARVGCLRRESRR